MKKHLQHLEFAIGLRSELPKDRNKVPPLQKGDMRSSWFIPPPSGEPGAGLPRTEEPYGQARPATEERAVFSPSDPDALLNYIASKASIASRRATNEVSAARHAGHAHRHE